MRRASIYRPSSSPLLSFSLLSSLSLSLSHTDTPSQMLCTVEKIPPAPEPPPLPLQPGGPTTRSPAGMEDEGIADDAGSAIAGAALPRPTRRGSAAAAWLRPAPRRCPWLRERGAELDGSRALREKGRRVPPALCLDWTAERDETVREELERGRTIPTFLSGRMPQEYGL